MTNFSILETAILLWVAGHYDDTALQAQNSTICFEKLELSGVGSYTHVHAAPGVGMVEISRFGGWPLKGPEIRSVSIEHGAGSLIWGKDGFINCIEICGYGDRFDEAVFDFHLLSFEEAQQGK